MRIPLSNIKSEKVSLSHEQPTSKKITSTKIINLISKISLSLCILSAITILGILFCLSILPIKYLLILMAVLLLITIPLAFFTFKKFTSIKKTRISRIICTVVSIIFTGIFCIIFFYLSHTLGFMDSIRASEYQIDKYYVLVKKDSDFATLDDLDNHAIATYDANEEGYQTAFEQIEQKITLKSTNYGSSTAATNAFIDDQTDSIFIKSSLADVLSEIVTGFNMETLRILDTIEIKTKIDTINSDINVTKDSFNIFISGIDTYGDISTVSRSDVNMIVTINPRTHTILLTSIPRDYYVQLHGTDGLKDKLTHAGLYGINMSINTLQDLYDIKIDYYIRVNFDSTINLINAIDGIDVTPDFTFHRQTNGVYCYYEEGHVNHLDGLCALRYARERKAYGTGDLHRIQNQQDVIMAIINKLTSSRVILTKYTDILSSMNGTLETNIPSSEFYKLINAQLDSMPNWTIERISAEGEHIDAPTYTFPDQYLFVFVPDETSVTTVSEKIKSVMDAN